MNTDTAPQSTELIKRLELDGTPFEIISTEKGHFLALGKFKISPDFEDRYEVEEFLEKNMWNVLLTVITLVYDYHNNQQPGQSTE